MNKQDFKPVLNLRKKNVQSVIDFCLETRQEFTLRPGAGNDDYIMELSLSDLGKAIVFGIFIKENKLECIGITPYVASSKEQTPRTKAEKASREAVSEVQAAPVNTNPAFEFENN